MKNFKRNLFIFILSESFLSVHLELTLGHQPDCLTVAGDIISAHQSLYATGQIVVHQEWFRILEEACLQQDSFAAVHNIIPWLILESITHKNMTLPGNQQVPASKFTSSSFAHLQLFGSRSALLSQRSLHLIGHNKTGRGKRYHHQKPGFISPTKVMARYDLHLVMLGKSHNFTNISRIHVHVHLIWLNCIYESRSHQFNDIDTFNLTGVDSIKMPLLEQNQLCIYTTMQDYNFLQIVDSCKNNSVPLINFSKLMLLIRYNSHFTTYKNSSVGQYKAKEHTFSHIHRSKWYKKGYLYDSLVFITKKDSENETNSWGAFSLVSWIGILTAYTVTAIVFGVIKIATMNNLDNSWYDCVMSRIMGFINEEKVFHRRGEGIATVSRADKRGKCRYEHLWSDYGGSRSAGIGNGSNGKSWKFDEHQEYSFLVRETHYYQHNRGKMSKAILYGTIRVVSFILLATYEGKLYNTITFPKSNLVTSFDELISGENYLIKYSNGVVNNESVSKTIKSSSNELVTSIFNESRSTGRVPESVNILDCVNWVESDPNTNHACVGYEFELRNLHKAQKTDKIWVKSKRKLLRYSSATSIRFQRRRGFTLFPGGFQISKWVLESGILQLWSMIENAFMESLFNSNWSDPFKSFTIRDYLGLFVVYALMLILATIMFLLENGAALGKRIVKHKKMVKLFKLVKEHIKSCRCKELLSCKCREREFSDTLRSRKYFRTVSPLKQV